MTSCPGFGPTALSISTILSHASLSPLARLWGCLPYPWHPLRHAFTAWGRLAGMKADTMRDRLGYASVLMTLDVYSHAQDRSGEALLIEQYAWPKLATEVTQ
jgi:hypothetical protein